jgi:hypothetical protein
MHHWQRAPLDGVELEYVVSGYGEPIVTIHNGVGIDWFTPLLNDPAATDRYRVIVFASRFLRATCSPDSLPALERAIPAGPRGHRRAE